MSTDVERAARHWDEHTSRYAGRRTGLFWYELPGVLQYINQQITGNPNVDWIEYTVGKYFPPEAETERCLSLGCGTGHLERELMRLKAFRSCDAFDLSEEAVKAARKLASEEGHHRIRYAVADVNQLQLPEATYDAAWFYGSLHHFDRLEHVLSQVRKSLKPAGLLAFNEYVGPARFQFPERQKQVANLCLHLLPRRYRKSLDEAVARETHQSGGPPTGGAAPGTERRGSLWSRLLRRLRAPDRRAAPQEETAADPADSLYREEVGFPSVADVVSDDPSESARSGEILALVRERFEVVDEIQWGGNIPQFLLSGIAGNFEDDDECAQALLEMIWKIDSTLIQCGEFESDFAYVVARPLPDSS